MNKEILKKAIATYGEEPQIRQCMEECAELISAIVDYAENDEADIDNIIEEMADVLIMCKQVEIISKDYVLEPSETEGVEKLGRKTICNYTIKSLAELIKTLNKYLRGKELPKYEICYKISCVLLDFEFFTDLLELDGVPDWEKQLNNKIKFKLNRLKERVENDE
jgi:NTP pyrophosphatase (non-canonical NTP hydrolase)